MAAQHKVELIPWDPTNEAQYQRMHDQRVACGWRIDEVPEWRRKHLQGTKFLYWIVISKTLPNHDTLLQEHISKSPLEKNPIIDTATTIGPLPRRPTSQPFTPIGHTALEHEPRLNKRFSFPAETLWVKSLYISWALQTAGLGRAAMLLTEAIARAEPHNARLLALDTMKGSYQVSEEHLRTLYDERGLERPAVHRTTQEWYSRQGWVLVEGEEVFMWKIPETGEVKDIPVIFMKKSLVN